MRAGMESEVARILAEIERAGSRESLKEHIRLNRIALVLIAVFSLAAFAAAQGKTPRSAALWQMGPRTSRLPAIR